MGHTVLTTGYLELYAKSINLKTSFRKEIKQCITFDTMKKNIFIKRQL